MNYVGIDHHRQYSALNHVKCKTRISFDGRNRALRMNRFDSHPAGPLIYSPTFAGTNFLYNNSYSDHKLLRLMEADGLEQIERGYAANADDFYVASREFTPRSAPNSNRYDRTDSGVSLFGIGAAGPTMTFAVYIHYAIDLPRNPSLQRLESDYIFFREYINRLSWSADTRNRTEIVGYRIYKKPTWGGDDLSTLVAEAAKKAQADQTYEHRSLRKDDLFVYRIIAVDRNGV